MPALLNQGITVARDALKTVTTNVGISTDSTAFNATQTRLDPTGTATNLIQAGTIANVDFQTYDTTMTVTGATQFTGLQIWTIGLLNGAAATNALSRIVRTASIGVQSGDVFTIGVRTKLQDDTP